MELAEAWVEIKGRDTGLSAAFGKAHTDAAAATAKIEARVKQMYDRIGAAGKRMTMLISLPIVAAAGLAVKAYMEQEKADRLLQAALQKTGSFTQTDFKRFQELASQLQKTTIYGDELTLSTMAYGHNLGIASGKLEEATRAAMGLAAKYRIDLQSAMKLIGRASQGQTQMLARYGIVLDESLSPQEKFNKLLEIGAGSFGLAEAEGKTLTGRLQILKNQAGELMEKFGAVMVPGLEAVVEKLKKVIDWLDKLPPSTKKNIIVVAAFVAALGPLLWLIAQAHVGIIALVAAVKALGVALAFLAANPIGIVITVVGLLVVGITALILKLKGNKKLAEELKGTNVELAKSYEGLAAQVKACANEEERRELLKAEAGRGQKLLQQIQKNQEQMKLLEETLSGKQKMRRNQLGWSAGTAGAELSKLRAETAKLETQYAESTKRRHLIVHAPIAPQAAAAEAAAEDVEAAAKLRWDILHRNAGKLQQLDMEHKQALKDAEGRSLDYLAAINEDFADRKKKLLAEIAKDEVDKAREVYSARVALYEAEVAAYGQAWASKLRMAGQEADAEKVLARSTFEAKARELMREFLAGKDVRMQMYASYLEYIEACRGVDKREADRRAGIMQSEKQAWRDLGVVQLEEAGKAADAQKLEARNALYEQIDNLRKLQAAGEDTRQRELLAWAQFYQKCGQIDTQQREASLTKQAGVLEKTQALFEKYSLELTRITQGRTAAELLEIDREADKEAAWIQENVKNQQQQADLLQALAVVTADKKQAIADQEMRTAEELSRRRREEERAKVGFISPTKVWEAATIAGMQRRYMEPPEMQTQRPYMGPPEMQARPPTGLEAAGGVLPNLGKYLDDSMSALTAIRQMLEKLNPAY